MGKIDRGRLTISTNISLTVFLITKTLAFGYVMLSIYIKVGDDILDENVMKMMNIEKVFGIPLGSTVQSIVFSLIGIFVLEFMAGVFGLVGSVWKKKCFLVIAVLMSFLMMIIYTVYIVFLSLIYHETDNLYDTLKPYAEAYNSGDANNMHPHYYYNVYPSFLSELGCGYSLSEFYACYGIYKQQVRTYLQTYFGMIITCFLCHVVSIIALEYTYRKLEFKEKFSKLSTNKYFLLLTIRHGIGRTIVCFVRNKWRQSKVIFCSVAIRIVSLIVHIGLLGLGLTLCGDIFITNNSLSHIFCQLKFYQYSFYDILIGLAASTVVFGILGVVISIISLLGSWRKSRKLAIIACISSSTMLIPRIVAVILFAVFLDEINDEMRPQLRIQQKGYYFGNDFNRITEAWNHMILALECCGVDSYDDTFSPPSKYDFGERFCCKNAHESRLDPSRSYSHIDNNLSYFGYCGGYKTDTCSGKILNKTRLYVGFFLGIVLLQIVLEVIGFFLVNKEYFINLHHTEGVEEQSKCTRTCSPLFIIVLVATFGIKSFFVRYCKRSKTKVVYFVSLGVIMILSLCILYVSINIRYDTVFGNGDIKELLKRITITDTNFNKAIENFSTVVSTFSVAAICTVVYSISILVPDRCKIMFVVMGLGFWVIMALSHMIEIGLWTKFLLEVNSSVTYQFAVDIYSYSYSHESEHRHPFSFYWNTLFVKAKCCGVSNTVPSFIGTPWYARRDSTSQDIPVQCCSSQTEVYPYESQYDSSCTYTPIQSYHTQGCDTVIEERLRNNYSVPFFVLTSLIVVAEVLCIITSILNLIKKTDQDETIRSIDVHSSIEHQETSTKNDEPNVKSAIVEQKSKPSNDRKPAKPKPKLMKKDGVKLKKVKTSTDTVVTLKGTKRGDQESSVKTKNESDKEAETMTTNNELDITDFDKSNVIESDVLTNKTESVDMEQNTSIVFDKRHSVGINSQSTDTNKDKGKSTDIERQTISSNLGERQSIDSGGQTHKSHPDKHQSTDSGKQSPNSHLSERQSVDLGRQNTSSDSDKFKETYQMKQTTENLTSKNDTDVIQNDYSLPQDLDMEEIVEL